MSDPFDVQDVQDDINDNAFAAASSSVEVENEDPFASSSSTTQANNNNNYGDSFGQYDSQSQQQQSESFDQFSAQPTSEAVGAESAAAGDDMFGSVSASGNSNEAKGDEETPLSKWQQQRKEKIQQMKQASEEAKRKLGEDAKADVTKFFRQREETLQKTMASNRLDEQNVRKEMEQLMKSGSLWEKVGKLTNLQPKANEDRRVTRMRKLLVQLKNKNDNAE